MTRRDAHEAQEKRNRLLAMRHARHRQELRGALENPWARRLIYRLIVEGRVFEPSYTGTSDTVYNEGLRAFATPLARQILDDSPATFVKLMEEGKQVLAAESREFEKVEQERQAARGGRRPAAGAGPGATPAG